VNSQARVLVIDDEPGMRSGVQRALTDFVVRIPAFDDSISLQVQSAATAEEGLEQIGTFRPDLLLLDHKLPGMSGLELLKLIEERREELDLLTIVMTAYASIDTAIRATKQGAYDFLAKPFTPLELRAAVRNAICHLMVRRRARDLAEERRQVRFQFISVLAHELKSPLAAVEGFLELIVDPATNPDTELREQFVERSLVRLRSMRKLINDLLDLTRIEAGVKKRELGEVDLGEVVQACIETATPQAHTQNVSIEVDAPQGLRLLADRGELEILMNNLLSNAIKYNRPGGWVKLRVEDRGQSLLLTVKDSGIGIAPADVERLFGDFVRIKTAQTRGIQGNGLGLSIVKKLAELYGGCVSVTSTPGVGTAFTVELQRELLPPSDSWITTDGISAVGFESQPEQRP